MPSTLDSRAKSAWHRLAKILVPMGVLTVADRDSFALLCKLLSDERKLELEANHLSLGSNDWKRVYVALAGVRKQLSQMFARFGMTPADRTRVTPEKRPPQTKKGKGKGEFFPPMKLAQ